MRPQSPTDGAVLQIRMCPAQVDQPERYEDTLTPEQRRKEILDQLAVIAARLLRQKVNATASEIKIPR